MDAHDPPTPSTPAALRLPAPDEPLRISIVFLLALAYFLSGRLSLLLAIPPGYASAIWPPAGIALGAILLWGRRYWIGVFLGSLVTNLDISLNAINVGAALIPSSVAATATAQLTSGQILTAIFTALFVATGAALQAVVGGHLLRKYVEAPITLARERDVLRFFFIGGPVTHIVNATWSVSALFAVSAIPASALAQHWWTWWVGDTIGAVIFSPLMVMWLSGHATWTTRRVDVSIPLLVALSATIVLFVHTSRTDWRQLQQEFKQDATHIARAIETRGDEMSSALRSSAALCNAALVAHNNDAPALAVNSMLFEQFGKPLLDERPQLLTLEWIPKVSQAERARFEASWLDRTGITDAKEDSADELITASQRLEYLPLQAVAMTAPGLRRKGTDLATHSPSREAMRMALAQNGISLLLAPRTDAQVDQGNLYLALPIYSRPIDADMSFAEREAALAGYVMATSTLPQLMTVALREQATVQSMSLRVTDRTDPLPLEIYRFNTSVETNSTQSGARIESDVDIQLGNRLWTLHFEPLLDYIATRQTASAWLVLAGGLFFTALIGAGALLVTGRAQAIEALVNQRTHEIAQINEKLADEICDHLSTEHALEKERELLKAVINNLYEGIFVLDTSGQLQMANGVAYRMLREITGQELETLPIPRPFRMYAPDGTTELLQEQTPHYCALRGQTVSDFEMVLQTPGRPAMTVIVNAQPLLTSDNRRHGAIIVMRDITDNKEVEKLKTEFVATVSHELRTPITSIRGSLGLIVGGVTGPLSDKTRNLVEIALRNSDRLAHLINDLLDIEKMESGKMQFELQRQPLSALIEQAVEANMGYAQRFNVKFDFHKPTCDLWVIVDSFRLLQVLSNLLSNAAKFSPPESTVDIELLAVVASNGAKRARVQVTDHGPGIPDEFRPRIFQKFSQADSSDTRAKGGTGLGLAICKTIVEQMGGSIGYDTRSGEGSTFYFELPQSQPEASTAATGT